MIGLPGRAQHPAYTHAECACHSCAASQAHPAAPLPGACGTMLLPLEVPSTAAAACLPGLAGLVCMQLHRMVFLGVAAVHGKLTAVWHWLQIPITFAAVCLEVHHGEVQVAMEAPLDAEALVWRFPLQVAQAAGMCRAFEAAGGVIRVCVGSPPDGVAGCWVA